MDRFGFYPLKYNCIKSLKPENTGDRYKTNLCVTGDHTEKGIDLNQELIGNKNATFFMRVSSDSMRDAGIFKGDIAIVDRSLKAENGRIVIVVVKGDMMIRRFERTNGNIRLIVDSNKLSPIYINTASDEDFAIWGVVTYVIHKA
jgi:DNA polymerase V